jgi:hypothetical protein
MWAVATERISGSRILWELDIDAFSGKDTRYLHNILQFLVSKNL